MKQPLNHVNPLIMLIMVLTIFACEEKDKSISIGGTYKFGDNAEKGPVGSVMVYPLADSSALFFLDISRGAPSYNSGQLFGQMAVIGSIGTYNSGSNCILKFKFASQQLEIVTEDGHGDCDFGGNVEADNKYKQIDKSIPKYYTNMQDDKILFEDMVNRIIILTPEIGEFSRPCEDKDMCEAN